MNKKLHFAEGTSENLITYVKDRAGHDLRYAIDSSKLQKELGWQAPHFNLKKVLKRQWTGTLPIQNGWKKKKYYIGGL